VAGTWKDLTDNEKIMLVALTGWGQESDRRRAQEAGFDAHLTKPVDFDRLGQLLGEGSGQSRSRQSGICASVVVT
jgi:CheY-like chemotaxis protein